MGIRCEGVGGECAEYWGERALSLDDGSSRVLGSELFSNSSSSSSFRDMEKIRFL